MKNLEYFLFLFQYLIEYRIDLLVMKNYYFLIFLKVKELAHLYH